MKNRYKILILLFIVFSFLHPLFGEDRIPRNKANNIETDEARSIVREILRKPEFLNLDHEENKEEKTIASFVEWLKDKKEALGAYIYEKIGKDIENIIKKIKDFFRKKDLEKPPSFKDFFSEYALFFLIIFIILAILVFFFFFIKKKKNTNLNKTQISSFTLLDENKIKPTDYSYDEWHKMAYEFSSKDQYLEALRALYLSLLSFLHRKRIIIYDRNKTNWEYYSIINRKKLGLEKEFKEIIQQYEKNWYGKFPCYKDDFALCDRNIETIKKSMSATKNENS
ncbi:MAG: hypothetical protein KAI43_02510 [Candidatus Aureabacteria bacterium]|nr:hypothetical protein [Candidatus Auribacterota bacterium]